MKDHSLPKYFLLVLLIGAIVACLWLFRPFLVEIIIAGVLASVFYGPFLKLSRILKGRRRLAAFLMAFFLLFIVVLPISGLIISFGKKSGQAYTELVNFVNNNSFEVENNNFIKKLDFIDFENENIKKITFEFGKSISDSISRGISRFLKGTTNFLVSLILILLTTFFFFIDGEKMLQKLKLWSPLPNKYDVEIFRKFREISFVALISTFVTAIAQGIVGAIGFMLVGLPAFYPGILIGFFSLIPYIGSMIIYIPIGIYLILVGQVFQGVFVIAWGAIIIGNIDNVIRAWILHGKSKMNPLFIIFSLLGGMTLFGFWGLVIGPMILSLVATIFYIYELEYKNILEE